MPRVTNTIYTIVILAFCRFGILNAQSKTNIECIYNLLDSAVVEVTKEISPVNSFNFSYSSPQSMAFLESRIDLSFTAKKSTETKLNNRVLNFTLNETGVRYNETFREWIFGEYLVEREIFVHGLFILNENNQIMKSGKFELSEIDTVKYDEIESLESPVIPFTTGTIPPEPFFSSLLEPAIAVGAAALTIFLFFNVRSK
jgi:hypothetical protein